MKKYRSSGSSLFLMEIILNILLFSILLCVSLQFIMKAHDLTIRSTQLERAVTTCNNLASIYESTSGTGEGVLETYDYAVSVGDHLFVYFDKNFIPCEFEDAVYTVSITPVSADTKRLHSAEITCYEDDKEIYSVIACYYEKHTLGGEADE